MSVFFFFLPSETVGGERQRVGLSIGKTMLRLTNRKGFKLRASTRTPLGSFFREFHGLLLLGFAWRRPPSLLGGIGQLTCTQRLCGRLRVALGAAYWSKLARDVSRGVVAARHASLMNRITVTVTGDDFGPSSFKLQESLSEDSKTRVRRRIARLPSILTRWDIYGACAAKADATSRSLLIPNDSHMLLTISDRQ